VIRAVPAESNYLVPRQKEAEESKIGKRRCLEEVEGVHGTLNPKIVFKKKERRRICLSNGVENGNKNR